jgi:(5-formylfuran-3-yl)methyl phosphate synthase
VTKLLVSVNNVEEALMAWQAGVDVIDLKDPSVGALGALDAQMTQEIATQIDLSRQKTPTQNTLLSATIGENHANNTILLNAIIEKSAAGIQLIKIAVNSYFDDDMFLSEIKTLINLHHLKLIAVFYAEKTIDYKLITRLASIDFFGVMIDTENKSNSLISHMKKFDLEEIVNLCKKYGLVVGVAGSLKPQNIETLVKFKPTYIGFRSGICYQYVRNNGIDVNKMAEAIKLLQSNHS